MGPAGKQLPLAAVRAALAQSAPKRRADQCRAGRRHLVASIAPALPRPPRNTAPQCTPAWVSEADCVSARNESLRIAPPLPAAIATGAPGDDPTGETCLIGFAGFIGWRTAHTTFALPPVCWRRTERSR